MIMVSPNPVLIASMLARSSPHSHKGNTTNQYISWFNFRCNAFSSLFKSFFQGYSIDCPQNFCIEKSFLVSLLFHIGKFILMLFNMYILCIQQLFPYLSHLILFLTFLTLWTIMVHHTCYKKHLDSVAQILSNLVEI